MSRYRDYDSLVVPSLAEPFFGSLIAALEGGTAGVVVDLACGTGATGRALAEATGRPVFGVDLDSRAVAFARAHFPPAALYVAGSAEAAPVRTGSAGAVVIQQGVQFFPDYESAAVEHARMLSRGGQSVVLSWSGEGGIPLLRELDAVVSSQGLGDAPRWERARSFDRLRWIDAVTTAGLDIRTDTVIQRTLLSETLSRLVRFFIDDSGPTGDRARAAAHAHLTRLGGDALVLDAALIVARKPAHP